MAITFASAVLAVMFVLRRVRKMQPIEAVSRITTLPQPTSDKTQRLPRCAKVFAGYLLLLTALALVCFGANVAFMTPDMKAGLFFGSAAMVLAGVILLFDSRLARQTNRASHSNGMNLFRLVVSNLSRHQWRTMLTVTLLASSLFVVGATGIFRLDIPQTPPGKTPPLCVETRLPIFDNLLVEQGRDNLITDPDDAKLLAQTRFIPFRVRSGQRTGCSNLYRAGNHLRLLGIPNTYVKQLDKTTQEKYKRLEHEIPATFEDSIQVAHIPILLDRNTAMYALQIYSPGAKLKLRNDQGQLVCGQVIDFLDQSIFQSEVIMSEENLLKYFPEVTGWQFFYVEQLGQSQDASASVPLKQLEGTVARTLGDYGPMIETVPDRLGRFFRVQNGYITIFQTLGALGVLLGTLGLAGLQVQDLFARRRELALLQTIGFSRKRIFTMLFLENAFMLLLAVIMAWLAMIVAVWPQLQNQLLAGTLSWTALVPSTFFALPAVGILLVGLLSLAFVWRMSQKHTGFQYLLEA
ncbi:MAG: ABC transporter permease, partial [Planctomycetia bacterium]|nr:ABC transporter permease [Planctomycetia bacterium]